MYSTMMWNFTSKTIFTILKCIRNVVVITGYLTVIKGGYRFFGYHKNGTLHSRWREILMLDYYFLEQTEFNVWICSVSLAVLQSAAISNTYFMRHRKLEQCCHENFYLDEDFDTALYPISLQFKKKKGGTLESYLKHWLSWGGITSLTKYASSLLGFLAISNRIKPPVNIFQILP